MAATGAQIRSILLGVIVFKTVPSAEKTTTNQMATFEMENKWGKTISALTRTIKVISAKTKIFTKATTLIFGGYFPGNFPPIDAAPQGIPAAKHAWKIITIPLKIAKMMAAVVTDISIKF